MRVRWFVGLLIPVPFIVGIAIHGCEVQERYAAIAANRQVEAQRDLRAIAAALDAFKRDIGGFPTTREGLAALLSRPAGAGDWKGPYIRADVLRDPWARWYYYRNPSKSRDAAYDLFSAGPDGEPGSADDIALTAR